MSPRETVAMKEPDMSRTARGGGYAVQTAGLARRFGARTVVDRAQDEADGLPAVRFQGVANPE
jgi:hypothetical protein